MRVRKRRHPASRRAASAEPPLRVMGAPLNLVLGAALRRIARDAPDVFDRLGPHRRSAFLIAPEGLPAAFRLEPDPHHGRVTLVAQDDPRPVAARIAGTLPDLLALFCGAEDADAAFFHRRVEVEGDTAAVVALHNALEAADLGLADLIGAPRAIRPRLNTGLAALVRAAQARNA